MQGKQPSIRPVRWGIGPAAEDFTRRAGARWVRLTGKPVPAGAEVVFQQAFGAALAPSDVAMVGRLLKHDFRLTAFALHAAAEYVANLSKRRLCMIVAQTHVPPFQFRAMADPQAKLESHIAGLAAAAAEINPMVTDKDVRNALEALART